MFTLSNLSPGETAAAIRAWMTSAFSSVQAQVQAAWNVEHNTDGTHGAVTAISVRTPRLRFRCRPEAWPGGDIFIHNQQGGVHGLPLDVPEGVQFVSIIGAAPGPYTLYGIRQHGVEFGDLLFVRRDPRSAANIELRDRAVASVPANTEIQVPQDASLSYPSFFLVNPCWTPLMFTPGAGTGNANGWALFNTFSA